MRYSAEIVVWYVIKNAKSGVKHREYVEPKV